MKNNSLNNLSIFNLSPIYGLIGLQGNDPLQFLQGLLTCDLRELDKHDHIWGAFCNIKGRVRALFRVFRRENHIFLLTPKELIPQLIPALKKYSMFSKISVMDASEEYSIEGIAAPEENSIELKEHLNRLLQSASFSLLDISQTENVLSKERSARFLLIRPKNNELKALFPQEIFHEGTVELWKCLDIQAGFPEIWKDTSEKFLPHHLNLPALGAVSFTKGCYCGQEIVARMEYKANIKVGLKYIEMDAPSVSRENIVPGNECEFGTVVSVSQHNQNKIEMLVIL